MLIANFSKVLLFVINLRAIYCLVAVVTTMPIREFALSRPEGYFEEAKLSSAAALSSLHDKGAEGFEDIRREILDPIKGTEVLDYLFVARVADFREGFPFALLIRVSYQYVV